MRALCSKYRHFVTKSATFSVICMHLDLYKMLNASSLQCLLVDTKCVSVLLHWYLLNYSCSYDCLIDARKCLSVLWYCYYYTPFSLCLILGFSVRSDGIIQTWWRSLYWNNLFLAFPSLFQHLSFHFSEILFEPQCGF